MKRVLFFTISSLFILAGLLNDLHAQEKATKEECIAKCKEAVALFKRVGPDAALKQLNQPDSTFRWKDSYVFVFETNEAKFMAHPSQRLIGWSMIEYRSVDNIMVFQEILNSLNKVDRGWISYQYLINQKPPPVQKITYYRRVPGENLVVAAGYHQPAKSSLSQDTSSDDVTSSLKIEEFARSEGIMHGIAFDGKGHMFVGRNGKEILKISPDGSISLFTVIREAEGHFIEGSGHTFLYDMEFDAQGILYAAAEDRILKITENGEITPVVEKKFTGNWGACGIALDKEGTVFYTFDNKIMKITPEGSIELFLDG